jgi:hypothetical protein
MKTEAKATVRNRRKSCRWCGSYEIARHQTPGAMCVGGPKTKAKRGVSYECTNCGAAFSDGDEVLCVDGARYVLHGFHWSMDALRGKLVTGPWGDPIAHGEPPPDRTVLTVKEVGDSIALHPHQHLEEILAAVRRRRTAAPPTQ